VGGAEHMHLLLLPLESLTACEEGAVRERAVEAIQAVTRAMPKQRCGSHTYYRYMYGYVWICMHVRVCMLCVCVGGGGKGVAVVVSHHDRTPPLI
jgi:hypothetical protein